jgi:cyclase
MLRVRIIPCLLLRGQGLVKTITFKEPKYVGDPINAVKIFNEKEVDELILVDITATVEQKPPSMKLIEEIARECFMPVCYGGGIRSVQHIQDILSVGIEKVAINSYAIENPSFIQSAAEAFGSQSIVVSMDVKKNLLGKYEVYSHAGKKATGLDPVAFALQMEAMGAGELFVNSIDRDGTMSGYELTLIKKISEAVSIPVIACGGAGKIADFAEIIKQTGIKAVAAGSLFVFYGKHRAVLINYPAPEEIESALGS